MKTIRFFNLIGIAGVQQHETPHARKWSRIFDAALIPVASLAAVMWYDIHHNGQIFSEFLHEAFNWGIWAFFATETLTLTVLVRNRKQYLLNNWFNLILMILIMPALWDVEGLAILRVARFMLIGLKLLQLSQTLRALLSRNHLGLTILACWMFAFSAGVLIAAIDPGINSISDGIWWAWVTVTTVGYGDVVPTSNAGRIIGGILMLIGMGIFSLFTANFSAFLVSQQEEKIVAKEQQVLEKETEVLIGEQRILLALTAIEERLKTLEEKLDQSKKT